ncbi:MmcB family DNA repair protein [Roseomonas sp. CCTCC AB2023176]|uniref:MmcB family DNA repair protein n=1 Tax=Roseomonas sp. CCTCC AB2023176 TaxID=3342640 RepID=UPI0035E03D5C
MPLDLPTLNLTVPERTAGLHRAVARACFTRRWAPLHEMPIPCGRRLDVMALTPEGCLFAVEIKSCARDYLSDAKWEDYLPWCDRLYFAVDCDFPQDLIPDEVGLFVSDGYEAVMVRDAPHRPLAAARRKSLLHRYAVLAAERLAWMSDPEGLREMRAASLVE